MDGGVLVLVRALLPPLNARAGRRERKGERRLLECRVVETQKGMGRV